MCIAFKYSDLFSILETAQQNKNWNKIWNKYHENFLAVQNTSIGDLVPWSLGWSVTTNNQSLHNTTEWPQRLVTFETFDQNDEETWPDQKRSTYLPTYLPPYLSTSIREHP